MNSDCIKTDGIKSCQWKKTHEEDRKQWSDSVKVKTVNDQFWNMEPSTKRNWLFFSHCHSTTEQVSVIFLQLTWSNFIYPRTNYLMLKTSCQFFTSRCWAGFLWVYLYNNVVVVDSLGSWASVFPILWIGALTKGDSYSNKIGAFELWFPWNAKTVVLISVFSKKVDVGTAYWNKSTISKIGGFKFQTSFHFLFGKTKTKSTNTIQTAIPLKYMYILQ